MTALTKQTTLTEQVGGSTPMLQFRDIPVKANTVICKGAFIVIDAGYAAPARTATGLLPAGRAEQNVDNTGGSAGAKTVRVRRGAFCGNNSASSDAITQADMGKDVYFVDDNTFALTSASSTRSVAGKFQGFHDSGKPIVEII